MKNLKYIVALAILFMISNKVISQNDSLVIFEDEIEIEDEKIYIHVNQMPEFLGGVNAIKRWIAIHLDYPLEARQRGIAGKVYIRFEVTKNGDIGKVELQRGINPILDNEAIRVVKTLPKFTPGELNGKKVNVWYSIPISFVAAKEQIKYNKTLKNKMPEFPGGIEALREYVYKNLNYTNQMKKQGKGTVYLRFEVLKTGRIGKIEIQKGISYLIDEEAKRIVKSLPKFTPGEQNGRKVNVWYSIPITFK